MIAILAAAALAYPTPTADPATYAPAVVREANGDITFIADGRVVMKVRREDVWIDRDRPSAEIAQAVREAMRSQEGPK
jgi:hypothetical protein